MIETRLIYKSETVAIAYHKHLNQRDSQVAFAFSGFGNRRLFGEGLGRDFLIDNGFDVISFISTKDDWFQRVPQSIFPLLDKLCLDHGYRRRVAMGSSMGGYAAICFSRLLRCDVVLAYSPQYSVADGSDQRFGSSINTIDWKYPISPESISDVCQYKLVYDDKDIDRRHAERIRGLIKRENFESVIFKHTGHDTIVFLSEIQLLKHVSLCLLNGARPDFKEIRSRRNRSLIYLNCVTEKLDPRRHREKLSSLTRMIHALETRKSNQRIADLEADRSALMKKLAQPGRFAKWAIDRHVPVASRAFAAFEIARMKRLGFDCDYYRIVNWDVSNQGLDPLTHFVRVGRRERRSIRFKASADEPPRGWGRALLGKIGKLRAFFEKGVDE